MKAHFAPMLFIEDGPSAIAFYESAFQAHLIRRYNNDDGSVHVAELSIDETIFHIREVNASRGHINPLAIGGVTGIIELWVEDTSAVFERAIAAGATVLSPVKDYTETGYRQGTLIDPFGHHWHVMRPISI